MDADATFAVPVVCETEGCANRGREINLIRGLSEPEARALLEAFGQGGEDSEDFCPCCGRLGVAQDAEDWTEFQDRAYQRGRDGHHNGSLNPFDRDSDEDSWKAWERGYDSMELEEDE